MLKEKEELKRLLEEGKIYIPLTNDSAFKSVLSQNPYYVIDIVFKLFDIKEDIYKQNYYIRNSELIKKSKSEKLKRADLVFDIGGRVINLEMNSSYYKDVIKKNTRYLYRIIDGSLKEGKNYSSDNKMYVQINFDNYDLFGKIISRFEFMDIKTKKTRKSYDKKINDPIIVHISLPLLLKKYYNKSKLSTLEKELLILGLMYKKEIKEVTKGNKLMEEVQSSMEKLTSDEEMRGIYLKEEQENWIRQCFKKDGFEDGIKEGIEQGIEKGREEEKLTTAKNMLNDKVEISIISKYTGLSIEEIKNLNNYS